MCVCVCVCVCRGEQRNNVLRDLFGPLVREILGHEDWALQTTPVDVYRSWINQMEMQTGEATYVHVHMHMHVHRE